MAPKAPSKKSESNKATKSRVKTPTKSTKYTTKDHGHNLIFLWTCFENVPDQTVNFKAVGEEYGINVNAARMRFLRLKTLIEKMSEKKEGDGDDVVESVEMETDMKEEEEEEEEAY